MTADLPAQSSEKGTRKADHEASRMSAPVAVVTLKDVSWDALVRGLADAVRSDSAARGSVLVGVDAGEEGEGSNADGVIASCHCGVMFRPVHLRLPTAAVDSEDGMESDGGGVGEGDRGGHSEIPLMDAGNEPSGTNVETAGRITLEAGDCKEAEPTAGGKNTEAIPGRGDEQEKRERDQLTMY